MRLASPPQSPPGVALPPTSAEAFDAARPEVQRLLTAIPSFLNLPDDQRKEIAADTVRVLSYITDPNGVRSEIAEREARGELLPVSTGQAVEPAAPAPLREPATVRALDAVEDTKKALSRSPGFAGKDFKAGAVEQGVEQFGNMVQKVDFPAFVGGLIKNVFQAIVESSIEQMHAYGELIANVAKTTDQFMRENIGEAAGRDYLADAYPDALAINTDGNSSGFADGEQAPPAPARLEATGEDPAVRLAEISRDMNINPPVTDLSDANAELRLVTAARLQMAKQRQQLLSSMVMLGINRIVITDGSINAKVVFDMRASDTAKREYKAQMHDRQSSSNTNTAKVGYGSWFSPVSASMSNVNTQAHVATVGSAVDESSESKAEVKAKLSGEVRVNFKSDYLPLDKMATPEMMSVIQGNSTPYNPNQPSAGAAAAPRTP